MFPYLSKQYFCTYLCHAPYEEDQAYIFIATTSGRETLLKIGQWQQFLLTLLNWENLRTYLFVPTLFKFFIIWQKNFSLNLTKAYIFPSQLLNKIMRLEWQKSIGNWRSAVQNCDPSKGQARQLLHQSFFVPSCRHLGRTFCLRPLPTSSIMYCSGWVIGST